MAPSDAAPATAPARVTPWRAALISAITWTAISTIHAAANTSDRLRTGQSAAFGAILGDLLPAYLPWVVFSTILFLLLQRDATSHPSSARLLRWLALGTLAFYLPQSIYQVALAHGRAGAPWSAFGASLRDWPMSYWLVDGALFLAAFAVVAGIVHLQQQRRDAARRQRLQEENLRLRLEVSQQRLATIRAQLEPHFLFNTLSAIAALVRRGDAPLALDAVQRLGVLLRYAIGTAEREWVTLGEEWGFVQGYLALQQLRHGTRLAVDLAPLPDELADTPIPPLLLQPLVENAVRHDVEGHQEASRIGVTACAEEARLLVTITNTLHPEAEPNPGSGLGLRATRDRLALTYGDTAVLDTTHRDGRFTARLVFPGVTDA